MRRTALLVALLTAPVVCAVDAHAEWPPGQDFDPAVALDVTPAGFDGLTGIVPTLVPSAIDIPAINMHDWDEECVCVFGCLCWNWWEYKVNVTDGWVKLGINDIVMQPKNGYLYLSVDANVQINQAGDPINIYAWGEVLDLASLDATCDAYVDPFDVTLTAEIYMEVVTGPNGNRLDVSIPNGLGWNHNLSGNDLNLGGCALFDVIQFIQDNITFIDPIGMLIDALEGELDSQIQALVPEIETALEDAFAAASIEQEVALGDAVMTIGVEPSDVEILPQGMRISMMGGMDAPPHECVAEYGISGSRQTDGLIPDIGAAPPNVPSPHHVGIFIADDFVNSGLFAAWNAGLLCYELQEGDGLPINTTLLTLLSRDAYAELFPDTAPMVIVTRPALPPEAFPVGPHDMNLEVRELGLDFYGELDGRMTRVLGTGLEADAGIDFDFDGTTGELGIDVVFDVAEIAFDVQFNELAPDYNEELEASFGGLFETILDGLLGDLLGGLSFTIPSIDGFGLQTLAAAPAGSDQDFFGLFGNIGSVQYLPGGCDDTGACDGGCTSGSAPGRALLLALPLGLVLLRRRRE